MNKISRVLATCSLIVFSSFIGLALIEAGLRLYGVIPSTNRLVSYEFDETLGWVTKPNFKYYRSSLNYGHFNWYNPDGFPTTEADFQEPASTTEPTVVLIGDSFAESYYVPYEQSFPQILDEDLTDKHVINLGVSGYAPDQYLLRARRELPRFSNLKNIVVMLFPYNDLPDLNSATYEGYAKPYFSDSYDKPINTPLVKIGGEESGNWLVNRLRHTAIYTVLRPLLRRNITFGLKTNRLTAVQYENKAFEKALRLINQIKKEFTEPDLLVYYVPYYEETLEEKIFQNNLSSFQETCEELNLKCASMDKIIKEEAELARLFIQGDGHFSVYGSERVARHLAELLRK